MKKHSSEHLYHAAQQMLLPAEIIGASRIEITGCSQILLSGHKGIRLYGEEEIIVDLRDCAADIQGSGQFGSNIGAGLSQQNNRRHRNSFQKVYKVFETVIEKPITISILVYLQNVNSFYCLFRFRTGKKICLFAYVVLE